MKKTLLLIYLGILTGCVPFNYNATVAMHRDKSNIQNNILISGQPQKRFLSIWGAPTRTYSRRFDTGTHSQISWSPFGGSGSFNVRGGETYDLWFYQDKKVTLVFFKKELMYWNWGDNPPDDSGTFQTQKIE
jgi:hypothetical protein